MIRASLWAVAVIAAGVPDRPRLRRGWGATALSLVIRLAAATRKAAFRAVLGWLDAGLDHLAAGDLVVGAQTQPGSKVFHCRPFAHIGTNFTQHFLDGRLVHAIDLGQIDSRQAIEGGSQIKMSLVLAPAFGCEVQVEEYRGFSGGSNSWYMASSSASQACNCWS